MQDNELCHWFQGVLSHAKHAGLSRAGAMAHRPVKCGVVVSVCHPSAAAGGELAMM